MLYDVSLGKGAQRQQILKHIPKNSDYCNTNLLKITKNFCIIESDMGWAELRQHFSQVGAIVAIREK